MKINLKINLLSLTQPHFDLSAITSSLDNSETAEGKAFPGTAQILDSHLAQIQSELAVIPSFQS